MTKRARIVLALFALNLLFWGTASFFECFTWGLKGGMYHTDESIHQALEQLVDEGHIVFPGGEDSRTKATGALMSASMDASSHLISPLGTASLALLITGALLLITIIFWPRRTAQSAPPTTNPNL